MKEKDKLAKKKAEKRASKAGSKGQNRAKRKPSKDQHASQDATIILVSPATVANADDTTQEALELDCECCECLETMDS